MPGALSTKKSKTLFSGAQSLVRKGDMPSSNPRSDTYYTETLHRKSRGHSAEGMRKAKGDRHFREGQACAKVQEPEGTSRG